MIPTRRYHGAIEADPRSLLRSHPCCPAWQLQGHIEANIGDRKLLRIFFPDVAVKLTEFDDWINAD